MNSLVILSDTAKYISHQLFHNKITFVYSQHENTNSKGDFVIKNQFEIFVLMLFNIQYFFFANRYRDKAYKEI